MRVLLIDFSPFGEPVTPISIGYIGATLQAHGHEVVVASLGSDSPFSMRSLAAYLRDLAPDLVGFTAYQRNLFHIMAIARVVKANTSAAVVIGGPQATFLPEGALAVMPDIDFVSRGEGEQTILAIVDSLAAGPIDRAIAGVTARVDGELVTGANPARIVDLDNLPSPWLSGVLDPATQDECIMLTSRGCPYKCAFCYTPAAFAGKIRYHSIERVLAEIALVAERGSGRMWFADPNFSFSKKRVVAILDGILSAELDVAMWIETRADMLDEELLVLMKRAGVHTVAMGLESASENVAPGLNKRLELEQLRGAVAQVFAHGMDVELFSQFALPRERLADAMATLDFVKQCGVAIRGNSNAQQMQLYYGSEVCGNYEDFGVIPLRDDAPPCHSIGTAFETEWMSAAEIDEVKAAWRAESLDGGKRLVS